MGSGSSDGGTNMLGAAVVQLETVLFIKLAFIEIDDI